MSMRLPTELPLTPYFADERGGARTVRVRLDRSACGGLALRYTLEHEGRLTVPQPRSAGPADGLWAHTCCEAFVAVAGEPGYREFNFSPSGQWAVFDFADYRQRADAAAPLPAPAIDCSAESGTLTLTARLPAALIPAAPPGRLLMLGLTAVAEDDRGDLQYWALRHPAERPDFHDRRGFALAFAPTLPDC